jgi:hypothetical protein
MSAFDRKVLEWLNTADLPDKSKQTVLDRTAAGIKTYRLLFDQDPKIADGVAVDFALQDVVARAGRRLKDGETPLVLLSQPSVPKIALRPSASRTSSRPPSARVGTAPATGRSAATQPATTRVQPRPTTASARAALVSKPTPIPRRATAGTGYENLARPKTPTKEKSQSPVAAHA